MRKVKKSGKFLKMKKIRHSGVQRKLGWKPEMSPQTQNLTSQMILLSLFTQGLKL